MYLRYQPLTLSCDRASCKFNIYYTYPRSVDDRRNAYKQHQLFLDDS